ncbi:MAG: VOC family protein [Pirellulaceae bacterium]
MSIPSRINLITLGVSSVKDSTKFYETLGWVRSSVSNENVTVFCSNGTVLGLFNRTELARDVQVEDNKGSFAGVTVSQNFRSEAEVDNAFQFAVANGATPIKEPQKVFWGGYSGYFADPDGHLWELAFNPFVEFDERDNLQVP